MATISNIRSETRGGLAPCPQKGLSRAVYKTIDACGGATLIQIQRFLPAALVNHEHIKYDLNKLKRCLRMLEYRGFLKQDTTGKWTITPYSYWVVRNEWLTKNTNINTPKRLRKTSKGTRVRPEYPVAEPTVDFSRNDIYINVAITVAALVFGAVVGFALGVIA